MELKLHESAMIALKDIEPNKGQIEGLPKNPRLIKGEMFEKLKRSISDNPEMMGLRELLVYPYGGKYVIIGGNMRYKALQELGVKTAPCKVIDADTDVATLKAYTIKDNAGYGEWDWELIGSDWGDCDLTGWGVEVPTIDTAGILTEDDEYERKKKEFAERMASGELSEDSEEYQEFLKKFELKKTTDDCYTPSPRDS